MALSTVLPKDCEDVTDGNGTYMINPSSCSGPSNDFNVYCEVGSDNQYWTVFQRRVDGLTDFYRTWLQYEKGFGDLTNEFWLGNDKVHMLISNNNYTLRIELEDFANEKRYAEYQSFKISDAQSNYQLLINGYSGDAGDSLDHHNGMPFSTKDRDNDPSPNACAVKFHGAWWYNLCHQSNLNGNYLSGAHTSFADGIEWIAWTGFQYSLKSSKMMIRRQNGN
ncbi:fibrinogen C domain-containing protein 1-A-like [Mytilus trossulus]|uniref:fibrinogen C domain-containing protein 1-A-like n=1 Tax=Mytilus trossulus TaxID=6551 RepID=UPI0030060DFE